MLRYRIRNRLPTQIRRGFPLYLLCIIGLIFYSNLDLFALFRPVSTASVVLPRDEAVGPHHSFPQKIWQTWKVDPLHFEERDLVTSRTWLEKNPGLRYEVITDANEAAYIEERFGVGGFNRPDIIKFYHSIELRIIKADLLRYMIMYADGGFYADIDVEALKPARRFIPERYSEDDVDIIVGIEIDQPDFKDHPHLGKKSMSFCQWTFAARPHQPVMLVLIENIMKWFTGVAHDQNVTLDKVELDFDQVISGTGPTAFTNALLEDMTRKSEGKAVTWDQFHSLDESKIVGRVLVLNVEAFCAGQGHSDSGNHNSRGALVKHHFHASNWPSRHHRYSHPAYGQVEDCNWDPECVHQWDENVDQFLFLSQAEKNAKVEERKKFLEKQAEQEAALLKFEMLQQEQLQKLQ